MPLDSLKPTPFLLRLDPKELTPEQMEVIRECFEGIKAGSPQTVPPTSPLTPAVAIVGVTEDLFGSNSGLLLHVTKANGDIVRHWLPVPREAASALAELIKEYQA